MHRVNCSYLRFPTHNRLKMKGFTAACAIVAAFGVAVQAESVVPWPEHGSIKLNTGKSPSQIKLELPGCLTVDVDWAHDRVTAQKATDADPTVIEGTERMRQDGGSMVVLITLEDGHSHIIVNAEADSGNLDTRMLSLPIEGCPISKLRVTSPNGGDLGSVNVGVSEEIQKLYFEQMLGASA